MGMTCICQSQEWDYFRDCCKECGTSAAEVIDACALGAKSVPVIDHKRIAQIETDLLWATHKANRAEAKLQKIEQLIGKELTT